MYTESVLNQLPSCIIVFRKNAENKFEYLMIRRRNTLGFVEFVRGKYNFTNYKYLYQIFSIMTNNERNFIVNNDFDHYGVYFG